MFFCGTSSFGCSKVSENNSNSHFLELPELSTWLLLQADNSIVPEKAKWFSSGVGMRVFLCHLLVKAPTRHRFLHSALVLDMFTFAKLGGCFKKIFAGCDDTQL